ncbi:phosphopantetheine-binding protein [Pseudoduganella violacea]|uniref:Acyl carrier protein n=2 Tax=Telluria group TaxID=2895353 RepID=A0A7W5B7H8_9BURK|nr:phosphopantetheine-binding protein [Pseudoduganella violacea]MBB3117580.1 acyl carrier protein [Pseudoduganella violacea]
MTIENSIAQVRDYLREQNKFPDIVIEDDLDLVETGVLDSLKIMALVIVIEKIRNRAIELEELSMDNLRTVNLIRKNFFATAELP